MTTRRVKRTNWRTVATARARQVAQLRGTSEALKAEIRTWEKRARLAESALMQYRGDDARAMEILSDIPWLQEEIGVLASTLTGFAQRVGREAKARKARRRE